MEITRMIREERGGYSDGGYLVITGFDYWYGVTFRGQTVVGPDLGACIGRCYEAANAKL